jgi:hypothetical protein
MGTATTRYEILRRYPRLVSHLICKSLGYFMSSTVENCTSLTGEKCTSLAGRKVYHPGGKVA